jgi:PAS domain S-box-containing protein
MSKSIRLVPLPLSPTRIFLLVLLIVFVAEAGVMFLLPLILSTTVPQGMRALVDASLLTAIVAPLLWRVIIGPLRRVAVSERARASSIIEAAAEGIVTIDERGVIESFNAAAERLFGYSSSEAIGRHISLLVGADNQSSDEHLSVQWLRSMAERDIGSGRELQGRCRDARVFPAWWTISQVNWSDKLVFTAIIRDLTEQKRVALQQRALDIARAEQMAVVAQLATGVAHELRNPMTAIKLLVQSNREELAARGVPDQDLDVIEREVLRMERSLRTFLEFARPVESGCCDINLSKLVDQVFLLVEGRASQQSVACVRTGSCGGPVFAEADHDKIQQLLLNLVLNALDAMPNGGTLEVRLSHPVNGQVELMVIDSGPGISAGVMPRLFEPFVTTKETGVGIGLSISRRIDEENHGSLSASNREEGGACFVLRLPAANPRKTR